MVSILCRLFPGQICDRWGRKMGFIAASALNIMVAVTIQMPPTHEAAPSVGHVFLGVAITVDAAAAPTWLTEMAHSKEGGLLGGMYMAIWYLAATIASGKSIGIYTISSIWAKRTFSIPKIVHSLLYLSLLSWVPKSPR